MQATRGGVDLEVDVAVMGAGAAGLYAALCAARAGGRVALVSAAPLAQTASYWAQGGLAAALAEDDSPELHLRDTERAGRGAMRRSAAETLVAEAPECVRDLQTLGVRFDADRFGRLALGLEGGHTVRRVVHAGGSATGRRLLRQLSALAVGEQRIAVLENVRAKALWWRGDDRGSAGGSRDWEGTARDGAEGTSGSSLEGTAGGRCGGVVCEDGRTIAARAVVLSTGGAAALWARTTNPPGSQGTGLLLGHALGAKVADLEFVQFHPTAVIGVQGREGFLITEAIRGEGATLHDAQGERFVDELAPRDEVARAIWARLRETGAESVGLDMRGIDHALFPNVVGSLREAGVDPARELVPVAPAAHYTMGGIVTDLQGRSSVEGLYAVGETSCTGLHGANRLASNSLSECFVWARRAAASALAEPAAPPPNARELA
ncbi:MAG: L-aspartate oxidase, partial [Solirubrobacteraceae bacterium]